MKADDPILALRARVKETYDVALSGAIKHILAAEGTDAELSNEYDISPSAAAQQRRAFHIRMAEVYAQIAQACHKIPGQQF